MVWPRLKVLWFRKDNLTVHSEEADRRIDGKTISKSGPLTLNGYHVVAQKSPASTQGVNNGDI